MQPWVNLTRFTMLSDTSTQVHNLAFTPGLWVFGAENPAALSCSTAWWLPGFPSTCWGTTGRQKISVRGPRLVCANKASSEALNELSFFCLPFFLFFYFFLFFLNCSCAVTRTKPTEESSKSQLSFILAGISGAKCIML